MIRLIIECKENIDNVFLRKNRDYSNTLKSVYKLSRFFLVYKNRYESNKNINKIIEITSLLSCLTDGGKLAEIENNKLEKKVDELEKYFQQLLSEILPPFKPEKVIKPEA